LWHGKPAQLSIHYEDGFTLLESTTGSVGREPKKLWSYPFEKLKMSSDDNNKLLWLDFGDSVEIVSIRNTCIKILNANLLDEKISKESI